MQNQLSQDSKEGLWHLHSGALGVLYKRGRTKRRHISLQATIVPKTGTPAKPNAVIKRSAPRLSAATPQIPSHVYQINGLQCWQTAHRMPGTKSCLKCSSHRS